MDEFTARLHAGHLERYAPGAFDRNIGKSVTVNLPDGSKTTGTVAAADVSLGGESVNVTMTIDPALADRLGLSKLMF